MGTRQITATVGLALLVGCAPARVTSVSTSHVSALVAPVTRVTQPVELQTRQTLDPVPESYVPTASADDALRSVPKEVAAFAQPKVVYLGAVDGAPVYVFRYDYCLPPAGGGAGVGESPEPSASPDVCANGATYDAVISADTGEFIDAGQMANSSKA